MTGLILIFLLQLQIVSPPPRFEGEPAEQGIVVLDGTVTPERTLGDLRVIHGRPPFVQEAQEAVEEWQFGNDTVPGERISVTFLFRNGAVLPDAPFQMTLPATCCPGGVRPAIPKQIIDPGYPVRGFGEGTVILEGRIGANGKVEDVRVVREVRGLTEAARRAVAQWRFAPANTGGRAVPSYSIVAIRFLRPETW